VRGVQVPNTGEKMMENEDHRISTVFDKRVCDARGTRGFVIGKGGDGMGESFDVERGIRRGRAVVG
jgi:hypothetical protein